MKKPNILLIDDDNDYVYLFRRAARDIEEIGRIDWCANGKEALDYFQKGFPQIKSGDFTMPDLVLVDINMPVMNGFEFFEKIEKWLESDIVRDLIYHPPAFLMLTSSTDPLDIRRSKKYKYLSGYLNKPFEALEYVKLIRECLALIRV